MEINATQNIKVTIDGYTKRKIAQRVLSELTGFDLDCIYTSYWINDEGNLVKQTDHGHHRGGHETEVLWKATDVERAILLINQRYL